MVRYYYIYPNSWHSIVNIYIYIWITKIEEIVNTERRISNSKDMDRKLKILGYKILKFSLLASESSFSFSLVSLSKFTLAFWHPI